MTVSEFAVEVLSRDDGETYAGGMTANDIESIKSESAELRKLIESKRRAKNVTSPTQS